jgi:hypothetical protein
MSKNWKRKIPLVILLATLGFVAFSWLVMILWNGILPAVLHTGTITFWQAAGILLLARLLFGGLKGRRHRMAYGCGKPANMNWHAGGNCETVVASQE